MKRFLRAITVVAIAVIPLLSLAANPPLHQNQSFSKAKKTLLKKVYYDHHTTFYCRVPFQVKRIRGKEKAVVNPVQSGFHYRKNKTRASRIEWEHVMPAEQFGGGLKCWYQGNVQCKKRGKSYKGRKCCEKVSQEFRIMQADMMNLVPAIGEVNGDRSNYRFMDTNQKLQGQYGSCPIKTDFKGRKTYPAGYTKGFIGRDYLYMVKKYGVKLSKREMKMMQAWAKMPEAQWEKTRQYRIEQLQGK